MVIAVKLAKAGYYGGDPQAVLRAPADIVLAALQYEAFSSDYERTYMELNKSHGV